MARQGTVQGSPPTLCRRKGDWQAREISPKNLTPSLSLPPPQARQLAFQSSLHRRGVGGGVLGFVVVAAALVVGRITC